MRAHTGCCLQRIVRPQNRHIYNKHRKPHRQPNGSCRTCLHIRTGEAETDALPKSFTTNRTTEIIASKETHVKSKKCGLTIRGEAQPATDNACHRPSRQMRAYTGCCLQRIVRPQKCDNHNKQRKPQRPPNGSCRTCPITRTGEAKTDALPKSFTTNRTTEIIASKETHVKSKRCGLTKKAEPPPTRDVNRDSGTDSANGGWLRRLVRPLVHGYKL